MKKPRIYLINYPERKCINCETIIPARTWPKKVCSNACADLEHRKKKREQEKLLWKQLKEQEQNDIPKEPIPKKPTSVTMADRWAKVYHNSSQEALRELAGLKTFRIKQAETCEELFALRKG